ncbi:DNA-binding protein (plasmid) [Clostridium botulinum B str. Eklund 17B (NRP)]|uniref:DNA-binding protein n=2 Tax=Clostridium botulinum TaxID=1491 RepID=B2TSD4_CLOBB|nr:helix-turn-helix transcriptional regulator [Clostridium botulinum]ACD14160.1 DNA-binding protein [Clostridium botulinum B str. Eklund 17B (NRP)]AIW54479.1 putative helix-turn-helix DNA binding protein [Clostridium botulinum]AIW54533.1 putative helix-turn-helix DNA binding protein [Clostridium botulinum]AIW55007.1 putative helix-turn-helix DNA binding protein [Clostridium botulinum]KFX53707.1 hypothetical protein KU40_19060 [Clostridium botulinum]
MNLIKKQRIKNKISQVELANLCKVKQSQISRIETNKELPSAKLIVKLATNLNLCPSDVFSFFYENNKCDFSENDKCNSNKNEKV